MLSRLRLMIRILSILSLLGLGPLHAAAQNSDYPFKVTVRKKVKKPTLRTKTKRQSNKVAAAPHSALKYNPRRPQPLAAVSSSPLQQAERKLRPWTVSGEVLGRGGLYSLNVDYTFLDELTVGMGFSYQSLTIPVPEVVSMISADVISLPFYGNFYPLKHPEHRPFLTGGITILSIDVRSEDVNVSGEFNGESAGLLIRGMDIASGTIPVPTLGGGYEYRTTKGFLFRGQALVMYIGKVQSTAGLALGYSF